MKNIVLISTALLSLSTLAHGQEFEDLEERVFFDSVYTSLLAYIDSPASTDSLCNSSLLDARQDLANGIIAVDEYVGFYKARPRYRDQLDSLIRGFGMTPTFFRGENCVPPPKGQTDGCYNFLMDKYIAKIYGKDFKRKLHITADSLFFEKNRTDTIYFLDCDKRPQLLPDHSILYGISEQIGAYSGVLVYLEDQITNPYSDLEPSDHYKVRANLIIDEKGDLVRCERDSEYVISSDPSLNQKLFLLATQEIEMRYSKWRPGLINGFPVKTKYPLTVYFLENQDN